jgi:hypothetical protein
MTVESQNAATVETNHHATTTPTVCHLRTPRTAPDTDDRADGGFAHTDGDAEDVSEANSHSGEREDADGRAEREVLGRDELGTERFDGVRSHSCTAEDDKKAMSIESAPLPVAGPKKPSSTTRRRSRPRRKRWRDRALKEGKGHEITHIDIIENPLSHF